jgi:hypothetical protein
VHEVHSKRDENQRDGESPSHRGQVVVVESAPISTRRDDASADVVIGGALQRNADGSIMKPRVMEKKDKNAGVRPVSLLCCVDSYLSVSRPSCGGGNAPHPRPHPSMQMMTQSLRSTAQSLKMTPRKQKRTRVLMPMNDLKMAPQSLVFPRTIPGKVVWTCQHLHDEVGVSNSGP